MNRDWTSIGVAWIPRTSSVRIASCSLYLALASIFRLLILDASVELAERGVIGHVKECGSAVSQGGFIQAVKSSSLVLIMSLDPSLTWVKACSCLRVVVCTIPDGVDIVKER